MKGNPLFQTYEGIVFFLNYTSPGHHPEIAKCKKLFNGAILNISANCWLGNIKVWLFLVHSGWN